MFHQTAPCGQLLVANIARKWLVPSMDVRMSLHLQFCDIRFAANRAGVSLVSGVNSLVIDQRHTRGYGLAAYIASVMPIFARVPTQMILQSRFQGKATPTNGALE